MRRLAIDLDLDTDAASDPSGGNNRSIRADEGRRWADTLATVEGDVFHSHWFHEVAQARGEGEPWMFRYRQGDQRAVLPLLLRPTPDGQARDATSVYGYAGPALGAPPVSPGFATGFQHALRCALERMDVISVFSRLHPLLPLQRPLLDGLGEVQRGGTTVSIDLTADPETQRRGYRGSHRREIERLRRDGYVAADEGIAALPEFMRVYEATMLRVGAGSSYMFEPGAYEAFLHHGMKLLVVRRDGELAAAGLFTLRNGIVHYFLSGTAEAHRRLAPAKLLLDHARRWAHEQGAHTLHLGGGVGGHEDALFRFKAGFSARRHPFFVWRWVLDTHRYAALCGSRDPDGDFFPAYRAP